MCGINGIFNFYEKGINEEIIKKMNNTLGHRGPDDQGVFIEGNIGLGNTRLSVLDLSSAGHQPMSNKSENLYITYNGEIYNYREIREILQKTGYHFKSGTDTEVILHSYEEWGPECLSRFVGMFAFAIWDKKYNRLFIARDRLGIKPLYYWLDNEKLVFASEIKSILEDSRIERRIDPKGLINYFTFGHSVAPDTIYQNIKKLLPGHYLVCENGKASIRQYWDAPLPGCTENMGVAYYKSKVYEFLEQSVQRRMIADVPLGVFLSGGIDSSIITGLMSQLSDQPVRTFSVGFDFGEEYNELEDARLVAEHFDTEHHELLLNDRDMVEVLQKLVYHYDEPFGDAAAFPTYLVSEHARDYVTVCLSGEGGDETFGGYRRYSIERFSEYYQRLPKFLKNDIIKRAANALPRSRRIKMVFNTMSIDDPIVRYGNWLTVFNGEMKAFLFESSFQKNVREFDGYDAYRKYYPKNGNLSLLDKIMYVDQKTWLPDTYLEKVDKASMAVGLETRVPFLDHQLVEFVATIPSQYKIKGFDTKYILRQAMKDLLPKEVLIKRKHGFAVPTDPWFRGEMKDFIQEILFGDRARSSGFFDFDYIEKLYNDHIRGREDRSTHIWLLLNFELWHDRFMMEN